MNREKSLNDLHPGQSAVIRSILSIGSIRRRLQDIGLIEGTKVRCVLRSPSGDPTAFLIRGAVIALRIEDSSNILIAN
ncbi:MAG: FeoA family protein [Oscillospiraceae bacterium]